MISDQADPAAIAFQRLHELVHRGYRAELGDVEVDDAIWLRHGTGDGAQSPRLILYPDGLVAGVSGDVRILAQDEAGFGVFARRLPRRTLQPAGRSRIWVARGSVYPPRRCRSRPWMPLFAVSTAALLIVIRRRPRRSACVDLLLSGVPSYAFA